jgi:hypothetical protein
MMPTVFCDNNGCIFIDEDGFCDCDKLDIVGGECMGSVHRSRSVTEGDACEKLKAANAKLRKLADAVKEFVEDTHCEDCPFRRDCDDNNRIFCADDFSYHAFAAMRKLGIEATDDD